MDNEGMDLSLVKLLADIPNFKRVPLGIKIPHLTVKYIVEFHHIAYPPTVKFTRQAPAGMPNEASRLLRQPLTGHKCSSEASFPRLWNNVWLHQPPEEEKLPELQLPDGVFNRVIADETISRQQPFNTRESSGNDSRRMNLQQNVDSIQQAVQTLLQNGYHLSQEDLNCLRRGKMVIDGPSSPKQTIFADIESDSQTPLRTPGVITDCKGKASTSASSEQKPSSGRPLKVLSNFFPSTFSIFEGSVASPWAKKEVRGRYYRWTTTIKRVVTSGTMRRLQERILGTCRADVSSSSSDIWLLGTRYNVSTNEVSHIENPENGLAAFQEDFSSRIWMTYRKGFDAIGETKYISDVNWGCMIRSSQMLVAQALLFHYLGRPWRKPMQTPFDPKYIELLHLFGDSEGCAFSIHNLLRAGKGYGLAAGSWVGPYAMCRSWEILGRGNRENSEQINLTSSLPMAIHIVSGDEDGERGGAPVLCLDVVSKLCSEFCKGEFSWAPILLLVPLVLGLDKVNPRYIPSLWATFTFPQSLGILGGKPGASTYIVGVQDNRAFFLDPHEVQMVADISKDNLCADTSSYHCSTARHLPLEQIDPSLAIGFYCRDKDDFDDFCAHVIDLVEKSNGAPLFTIAESLQSLKEVHHGNVERGSGEVFDMQQPLGGNEQEDDWQLL